MLKELKFVQGAVAKKDLLPAMTHFRIEGGHVRSYNGTLALSSPLPFDIDCNPKADQLVRAIGQCQETVTLSMTPGGSLRIQSGKFRAFVQTIDGPTPHVMPEGDRFELDGQELLNALRIVYDFIGNDASRPWTNGVLLHEQSAYATNNTTLVQYWIGSKFPFTVNVPRVAVKEILRVNEPPTHAQLEKNSITFHFTDGRWIRTQLLETTWPDLTKVLDKPSNATPIDPLLFEGIETLKAVCDGANRIFIKDGVMRTHLEEDTGGTFDLEGMDFTGVYQIHMLALLKGVVTRADFTLYPKPCLFFGERLRGAIIGMRSPWEGQQFSATGIAQPS